LNQSCKGLPVLLNHGDSHHDNRALKMQAVCEPCRTLTDVKFIWIACES